MQRRTAAALASHARIAAAVDLFKLVFNRVNAIKLRLQLGDLLIRAKLVTQANVTKALAIQGERGGRLGDHLVAMGAIDQESLDDFLHRMPAEPADLRATKIDENELLTLLMKLIFANRLESVRQFVEAIKLPYHVVLELVRMGVDRQLLRTLGAREPGSLIGNELRVHRAREAVGAGRASAIALLGACSGDS